MIVRLLGGVEGRSVNVSPESCINLFYEKQENGEQLINTPGSTLFVDLGSGEVRGGIAYNDKAYFVAGNTLYEVDAAGNKVSRGALNGLSGRVSMAHNGTRAGANQQIMIVDGVDGYIYDNTTSTLSEISDTDFTSTESVVFIDGYFIYAQKDTDRFWLTNLFDGTTVDATDFTTAEGAPDKIQSLVADQRGLYALGKESLEVFYNTGDADNTFQRFQGGFKQMGCGAPFSPARFDNTIAWLTQNERGNAQVAILGSNYNAQIISTPELDYQLAQYTTISDAFGYAYQFEGNEFYVLNFPIEKKVWAFNARTQRWHQQAHTINDVFPNRERYNCHVFAFNKHLLGDFENGKVYQLDSSVGTIESTRIPRQVITPNVTDEEKRIRISQAQVDLQEGTGDPNVSTDASIWLSYSKDGGHTYSNEIEVSMGNTGKYRHRALWRRLGKARNWIFKLRTWTPNKVVMKGLYLRPYGQ